MMPAIGPLEPPAPTSGPDFPTREGDVADEYLLLSIEREHEAQWLSTAVGVAAMADWCAANGMPPPTWIASGTIQVWQTDLGPMVRYKTFVIDHLHGGWARDSRKGQVPLRHDVETPYTCPLPEGVGKRHDRLPFPPLEEPEDVQCDGQTSLL